MKNHTEWVRRTIMDERTILITKADMGKLTEFVEVNEKYSTRDQQQLEMLARELERAEIVPAESVPSDVITMNSQARVRDLDSRREIDYTLVFPEDADISENRISVLAPIGTALLGYRKGDEIQWKVPGGWRRLKVLKVLYQPEAAGDEGQHTDGVRPGDRASDRVRFSRSKHSSERSPAMTERVYGRPRQKPIRS
jgi:regulator of nucleoside diphosphate kinase